MNFRTGSREFSGSQLFKPIARTTEVERAVVWGAGTVYLEELADLPMASQAQLFQLMSGEGNGHARLQARLICGTSRDLETRSESGPIARGSLLPCQWRVFAITSVATAQRGHPAARGFFPG